MTKPTPMTQGAADRIADRGHDAGFADRAQAAAGNNAGGNII